MREFVSELIFNDVYRIYFLNIYSILIAFWGTNYYKEKYYVLYFSFSLLLILPFLLIILIGIAFTNFDNEVIKDLLIWSFKWITYFSVIFVLQCIIILYAQKFGKILKILFCILLLIVSLFISLTIILPYITL